MKDLSELCDDLGFDLREADNWFLELSKEAKMDTTLGGGMKLNGTNNVDC